MDAQAKSNTKNYLVVIEIRPHKKVPMTINVILTIPWCKYSGIVFLEGLEELSIFDLESISSNLRIISTPHL